MNLRNLTTLSLLLLSVILYGQSVHPDYKDGYAYLKFENESDLEICYLNEINRNPALKELRLIFDKYGVTHIERPFINLRTPVFDRTYKVKFSAAGKIQEFTRDVSAIPYIEYAERVELLRPALVPNDPQTGSQYALGLIDAYEAWDIHTGGNAVVAIVDDAVRITHSDLAPNVWVNPGEIAGNGIDDDGNGYIDDINGWDAANNDNNPNPPASASDFSFSHGTHCAGIACGASNNGTGIASIGFNNKIMAVKCTSDGGNPQFVENGYEGVAYAIAAGADVISMSWGGDGSSQTAQNVFTQAHNVGITLVAAAGNSDVNTVFYPAGYNFVISVASSTSSDTKSSFSNYGTWIDITAPGSSILSTVATSTTSYQSYDGTSMACPMVAGLAGLLKSYDPSLTPDEIESCMDQSADNIDAQNPSYVGQLGSGRINAFTTMQCVNPENPPQSEFQISQAGEICPGTTIQFTDLTIFGPDTWSWSFPGGTPSSSSAQNPTVTYGTAGTYDVTLTTTNQFGTDTETKTGFVVVGPNGSEQFFLENFEGTVTGWTFDNPDGGVTWDYYSVGGSDGTQAVGIDNYNYNASGQRDGLISPILDFSGRANVVLNFDYAHRRYSQNEADSLIIYISSDGGTVWNRVFQGAEDGTGNFATNTTTTNQFIPASLDDWCYGGEFGVCPTIDLSAYDGLSNIRLKFENVNDYGNNLYIDNVRLNSSCFITAGAPTADFTVDMASGCPGDSFTFQDLSTGNPVVSSWSWSFPGGTPSSSSAQNPTVVYNTDGSYNVTLTVNNGSGSDSQTINGVVVVDGSQQTTFYLQEFEAPGTGWSVDNPDGNATWTLATVAGTTSGTSAAAIDNYNNDYTGERDGLISPILDFTGQNSVTLDFDYAYRRYDATYQDSLVVYISNDGGTTFTRIFEGGEDGSGNFVTNSDLQAAFTPTTTDDWCFGGTGFAACPTIDLSAYDNQNNIILRFENISGYGNFLFVDNVRLSSSCDVQATPPTADFTLNSNSGCEPFTLNATDVSTGSPTSWSWTVTGPENYTSSMQNPSFTLGTQGSYSIQLTVANMDGTDTYAETVTVNPLPQAGFTSSVSGANVSFTNTSVNATSYLWDFGDGNTSTAVGPVHSYMSSGTYNVTLTVTNSCGSASTSESITIILTNLLEIDGLNSWNIIPNPSNGQFNIQVSSNHVMELNVQFFDVLGRVLEGRNINTNNGTSSHDFDLSQLAAGTYFIRLSDKNGASVKRIIIE